MRINEGKQLDGRRRQKLGFLRLVVLYRHAVDISVKRSAQLVGPSAQDLRMVCNRVFVRRATINAYGFVIGIQYAAHQITRGEVVNAIAHGPGWLDAPGQDSRPGSRRYVVRGWNQPVVIIDIQAPAK